jgi:hypothetical protein
MTNIVTRNVTTSVNNVGRAISRIFLKHLFPVALPAFSGYFPAQNDFGTSLATYDRQIDSMRHLAWAG